MFVKNGCAGVVLCMRVGTGCGNKMIEYHESHHVT